LVREEDDDEQHFSGLPPAEGSVIDGNRISMTHEEFNAILAKEEQRYRDKERELRARLQRDQENNLNRWLTYLAKKKRKKKDRVDTIQMLRQQNATLQQRNNELRDRVLQLEKERKAWVTYVRLNITIIAVTTPETSSLTNSVCDCPRSRSLLCGCVVCVCVCLLNTGPWSLLPDAGVARSGGRGGSARVVAHQSQPRLFSQRRTLSTRTLGGTPLELLHEVLGTQFSRDVSEEDSSICWRQDPLQGVCLLKGRGPNATTYTIKVR
jgi:hypothetical protein